MTRKTYYMILSLFGASSAEKVYDEERAEERLARK